MKKLFAAVLLLFTLGEIVRLDLGNGVFLKPVDIAVGLTVITWLTVKLVKKEKIKEKRIFYPILFFAGSGTLSLLINYLNLTISQLFISSLYLVRWITYSLIFFIVLDFYKDFKKKISKLLVITGSIVVVLGYIQYLFYSSLRNLYYLGWDEHMFRMFSVFLDPNFAGAFFVLFFLFLINLFLGDKSIAIGLLLILTLGAIFLTFSRSALIMFIVSSSLLLTLSHKKKLIMLLLTITLTVLIVSSKYFNVENINLFRIVSSEARLETAGNALTVIKNNPFFGVGFNAYRYAQFRYGLRNNNAQAISHADAGTDNSFLFIIATTGIIGFILYLFLWYRIFKITSILVTASIAGVFVSSLFINTLFYPFIMLWLWIILALSSKNQN